MFILHIQTCKEMVRYIVIIKVFRNRLNKASNKELFHLSSKETDHLFLIYEDFRFLPQKAFTG